jgi:glucose-1-phosphate cytidylyltransferase
MLKKVVILAGGLGTRLGEETETIPKPMVQIGDHPILWHIMKLFASHEVTEFVICLGYKGYVIKEYFANYFLHNADVTFDLSSNSMEVHSGWAEPWKVTLVDTGAQTMTGGRLKRVARYLGDEVFCMTYGDGLADLDISRTVEFHRSHGRLATVTAVRPPGRFGALEVKGDRVSDFREKPTGDRAWINGGFFVLSPKVLELIDGDATVWEREPMEWLAHNDQLRAFYHDGFWHPMDTLRDKNQLEEMWRSGKAPWKSWP